ncbi:hypothetical protein ACH5RR_031361 [Cinchona calisaya]|uniref:Uncharacterized protein n=1 Tax=Cinchona calisaya TaxID=153742 RepID=A0ABD2YF03_9GENT
MAPNNKKAAAILMIIMIFLFASIEVGNADTLESCIDTLMSLGCGNIEDARSMCMNTPVDDDQKKLKHYDPKHDIELCKNFAIGLGAEATNAEEECRSVVEIM